MNNKKIKFYSLGLSSCELYTEQEMTSLTEKHLLAEKAFFPITKDNIDNYVELMTPEQIGRHRATLSD